MFARWTTVIARTASCNVAHTSRGVAHERRCSLFEWSHLAVLHALFAHCCNCLQERQNVAKVVKQFNLSQKFVDMSYGVFNQLDLDSNGAIDQG